MKADLHVHSHYSDGADSVETVVETAKKNGVTHLSLVDHDTVDSLAEAQKWGNVHGVIVIPGIEISAYDFKRNRKVHVLGYDYQPEAIHIRSICDPLLERRHEHSLWQVKQIKSLGYDLKEEKISKTAAPSNTIYKQHIMAQLTSEAYSSTSYQQLYRFLFKNDGVAAGDITYVDAREAVEAIAKDGGYPVVAHPGQLDSFELIPELIEAGLKGIELAHPDHTEEDHARVKQLAKNYHLMLTGGTDYHGAYGAPVSIGSLISPLNDLL